MTFKFDINKAFQSMAFIVCSLEGVLDLSRLLLLLYLADKRHLARHGSLIFGDSYVAMKYGAVPLKVLGLLRQLTENEKFGKSKAKINIYVNDKNQVVAKSSYNASYLAASEVECMFETIQEYKNVSMELLSAKTMDTAWLQADINGGISLKDMAVDSGATPEMIDYIETCYSNEVDSFINVE